MTHGSIDPGSGQPLAPASKEDFQELYERFYRPVYYFFANRGFSTETSQDLTQQTFLRVFKNLENFRSDTGFESWLFRVAANIWRNELRHRSASKRSSEIVELETEPNLAPTRRDQIDAEQSSTLTQVLTAERSRLLRQTLDELPVQMRRCLLLRIDQDLSYREIADVMQISIQTVRSQLFRARNLIKERLGAHLSQLESDS